MSVEKGGGGKVAPENAASGNAGSAAEKAPAVPKGVAVAFPPLVAGTLVGRRQRFLADVVLEDGGLVTAHTSNTGSMLSCSEPGSRVHLSRSDNPRRKHPFEWELTETESGLAGVNTALPNKLARLALEKGALGGFPKGGRVFAEVTRGKSRLDLLHVSENGRKIYVEVKNCTLAVDGVAYFPDAVSKRAAKHLAELDDIIASGSGGVLLVLVQRQNARVFSPADHIDPEWGKALRKSAGKGLTLMVREVRLSLSEAALGGIIPAEL